jgi:hypothetical protein
MSEIHHGVTPNGKVEAKNLFFFFNFRTVHVVLCLQITDKCTDFF